jgi:4-amino-4-deoxy-L-arabinose transferase-like glycosyltransferase
MGHYFNKYSEFLLLVFAILVFTSGINLLDIYSLDEVKNAVAAKEMLENQSFYYPTFNNELRTDKPPLHYFFMMLAYKIFGVTPFAARLFSSLMGVLVVLAVYYFVKKAIDKKIATYAALLLLASLHFGIQMHMAVPDPYLIFFLTLAGFSFYFLLLITIINIPLMLSKSDGASFSERGTTHNFFRMF